MCLQNDLISVIVPVYNVFNDLPRCIDSILSQTYTKLEILLIDDGSLDGCGKICDEYAKKDSRIVVIHKTNGGLSDARNVGIKNSKGTYLTFVDSDDYIENDCIEYLYDLICKYQTDLSIASFFLVRNQHKYDIGRGYHSELLSTEVCLERLLCSKGFNVSAWAKMYHRRLFETISFPTGKLCEDNGTTYKAIMQCEFIAYGNKPVYHYIIRDGSIMTSAFSLKKLDLLELVDLMCSDILKSYPNLKESADKKLIESRFSILRQLLISKEKRFSKIEDEMISYLFRRKRIILLNRFMTFREKSALISLFFGKRCFQLVWKLYTKIR